MVSVAAVSLLSTYIAAVTPNDSATIVEAAKSSSKKLSHKTAIYTASGKKTKRVIKKGKTVKVLGYKSIKGTKYARIGKNAYVKVSNLSVTKKKKPQTQRTLSFEEQWDNKYGSGVILTAKKDTFLNWVNSGNMINQPAGSTLYVPSASVDEGDQFEYNGRPARAIVLVVGPDDSAVVPYDDYTPSIDPGYSQAAKGYNKISPDEETEEVYYYAKVQNATSAYIIPASNNEEFDYMKEIVNTVPTIPTESKLFNLEKGIVLSSDYTVNGIAKDKNGKYCIVFHEDTEDHDRIIAVPAENLTWVKNNDEDD